MTNVTITTVTQYHNLIFWVLSQFELLSFVFIWAFELCLNLSFWVLSQIELSQLEFFLNWVFELSQLEIFSFVTIWVLSQFKLLSFVTRGTMFRWTLKLKKVLNKRILSASVPEAAVLIWNSNSLEWIQGCRPVLLLLVLGMLEVLVGFEGAIGVCTRYIWKG